MKNIGELMAKAQKVQSQMTILQSKMEQQEFTGEAGNGAVTVVMTGKGRPVSVKLDKAVVDPADVETLGDLVQFNKTDLLKFRNFGKKSLTELDDLLESLNLSFGTDISKYKLDKE